MLRRCIALALTGIATASIAIVATSAGASASGGVTTAKEIAAAAQITTKAEQVPTSIGITTPLKTAPPKGKTIVFLRCDQTVCGGYVSGLQAAAKALDWHLVNVNLTVQTPQGTQAAIASAIQLHPNGIFFTGQPRATVMPEYAALKAAHIAVVSAFDDNVPGQGPIIANAATYANVAPYAKVMAAWTTARSLGKADVALFDIPSLPILAAASTAYQQELTQLCPGCTSTVIHQQITDLGTTNIASSVVSTLQANPNIHWVGFVFGDMVAGVPAALKAAGLENQAKLFVYSSSSPSNLVDLSTGAESADTAFSIPYFGWRAMDAFARDFEGQSTSVDTSAPLPGQILDKSNVILGTNWAFAQPANMAASFEKLWNVG
jgi:ribose transport system substrate-binding protein